MRRKPKKQIADCSQANGSLMGFSIPTSQGKMYQKLFSDFHTTGESRNSPGENRMKTIVAKTQLFTMDLEAV